HHREAAEISRTALHLAASNPNIKAKLVQLWSELGGEKLMEDVILTPLERAREPSEVPSIPPLGPEVLEEAEDEEEEQRPDETDEGLTVDEALEYALRVSQDLQRPPGEAAAVRQWTLLGTPEDNARVEGLARGLLQQRAQKARTTTGEAAREGAPLR
ncbi:hypothetical protein KFL_009310010, partial [Klebsormidium nitens]